MALIDKKTLEHLASLSRLKLNSEGEEKLLSDSEKILEHFQELKEVDTTKISPMTGGTFLVNEVREDKPERTSDTGFGTENFPDKEDGFLKVPSVF